MKSALDDFIDRSLLLNEVLARLCVCTANCANRNGWSFVTSWENCSKDFIDRSLLFNEVLARLCVCTANRANRNGLESCCIVDNCTNDPKSHGLDWWKVVRAERCGLEWDLFQLCCDRIFRFLGLHDLFLERIHIVNELNVSEYSGRFWC